MKKYLLLGAAALLILNAAPAFAQADSAPKKDGGRDGGKYVERMFERGDRDGNGTISEAEFVENAKSRFGEMDADKDGVVTKDEAKAHNDAKRAEWKAKREKMKAEKEGAGAQAAE
jgi:hypothetical protein